MAMLKQQLNTFVSPRRTSFSSTRTKPYGETSLAFSSQLSEETLKLSELRYRRLFETAQDGILILDADSGKIADANPFLQEILGYSQAELLGKELWQIGVFKDIVDSKAAFLKLQKQGYIRYKDLPLQTKYGQSIDVEFVSNVYMVGYQKVIQCNIRNITDRKKAEDAATSRNKKLEQLNKSLKESRTALLNVMEDLAVAKSVIEVEKVKDEAMLASIGEGLIAVDNDRRIMIINKAAENMLGWTIKDLVGKKITSITFEDEEGHLTPLDSRPSHSTLSTDIITKNPYFFVRKDKTRFPVAITVTPIKLGEKTIGAINIFRDITREKEIDRAKSDFVSLASHQLRTPLGIAKWYIEAIRTDESFKNAPEITKDYLNEVYKSNERLLILVRELLSISRIDQGKVRDTPHVINITQYIKDVVKELNILAAKNTITIHMKIEIPESFTMRIDPLRFQEMLENLLANAIEYSDGSGKVDIIVRKHDDKVIFIIQDSGIGMSREDKKNLYMKFYRSEKAISKNTEGSGLGLYVVKSYVEGWNGTIAVTSEEGKGTTFTISLPMTHQDKSEHEKKN